MFPHLCSFLKTSVTRLGVIFALPTLFLFSAYVFAQNRPITNEDVAKMIKSGFSEEMVINVIEANDGAFDNSVQELLKLKQSGVSEKVLGAMMAKARKVQPTSASSPSQAITAKDVVSADTKAESKTLVKPPKADPKGLAKSEVKTETPAVTRTVRPTHLEFELPTEEGVYLVEGGQLVELFPEVVNWKTGGTLKGMASMGLTKGHINGTVRNPHSRRQTGAPLEIIIRCPQGIAPTEYQLLDLWEKDNRREFRARTGGIIHSSAGAQKNALEFEPVKIAPSTYKIVVNSLKKGEYGFLAPGVSGANMAASGKIHTFGIE